MNTEVNFLYKCRKYAGRFYKVKQIIKIWENSYRSGRGLLRYFVYLHVSGSHKVQRLKR